MEHGLSRRAVRCHRRRCGISQQVLGGLVGRSESWGSQVERGEPPVDRISVVAQVADALRVKFEQLLGLPFVRHNGTHAGVPGILQPEPDGPLDLKALRDVRKAW